MTQDEIKSKRTRKRMTRPMHPGERSSCYATAIRKKNHCMAWSYRGPLQELCALSALWLLYAESWLTSTPFETTSARRSYPLSCLGISSAWSVLPPIWSHMERFSSTPDLTGKMSWGRMERRFFPSCPPPPAKQMFSGQRMLQIVLANGPIT